MEIDTGKKEIVVVNLGRVIIIDLLSFFFQFYMKSFRKLSVAAKASALTPYS